jgi:hypothetical protein
MVWSMEMNALNYQQRIQMYIRDSFSINIAVEVFSGYITFHCMKLRRLERKQLLRWALISGMNQSFCSWTLLITHDFIREICVTGYFICRSVMREENVSETLETCAQTECFIKWTSAC